MMERLAQRGEALAREAQRRSVARLAQRFRVLFGVQAVQTDDAQVVVNGRGLMRRWLVDPALRFLSGGLA
jgi:hypothetical protein